MIQRVELLVHAGAPSRREDDDRYKAQAQGYLDFYNQAIERTRLSLIELPDPQVRSATLHLPQGNGDEYDATTYLEDTQLACTVLNSQLFTSSLGLPEGESTSLDYAGQSLGSKHWSPGVRGVSKVSEAGLDDHRPVPRSSIEEAPVDIADAMKDVHQSPEPEDASQGYDQRAFDAQSRSNAQLEETPVPMPAVSEGVPLFEHTPGDQDSISTSSSYLRTPLRPSKRPKLGHQPQQQQVGSNGDRRQLSGIAAASKQALPTQQSQVSVDGDGSNSELPTTYSLSDITSDNSKSRPSISQRSASDPGPQSGRAEDISHHIELTHGPDGTGAPATRGPLARSETAPPKVPSAPSLETLQNTRPHDAAGKQQPADVGPHGRGGLVVQDRPSLPLEPTSSALDALSTSIAPPSPKIALDQVTTHVTAALQQLVDLKDLSNCFRPISTTRELRPLERGHWLVKVPANDDKWTIERQVKFWTFLERWIADGSVGWGVWCAREPATGTLGTVQVYCWGEVVKHVYHMIYTASVAQTRKMGLQWIDGAGNVIVQMRGC